MENCRVCKSKDRAAIERLLAEGQKLRAIGKEFGFDKNAIWRHSHDCPKLQSPAETADALHIASLERLKDLYREVRESYKRARQKGDTRSAAALLGQLETVDSKLAAREHRFAQQHVAIHVVDENGVHQDLTTPRPPNEAELLRALSTIYGLPFIGEGNTPEHESVLQARLVALVEALGWEAALETVLRSAKAKMTSKQTAAVVDFLERWDTIEKEQQNHVQ
jgi:hypothetical protein